MVTIHTSDHYLKKVKKRRGTLQAHSAHFARTYWYPLLGAWSTSSSIFSKEILSHDEMLHNYRVTQSYLPVVLLPDHL